MERLKNAGTALNGNKYKLSKSRIKLLGHMVLSQGITVDPEKLRGM